MKLPLITRYRPKRLDEMVGQPDATQKLQAMFLSKCVRPVLLIGSTGSGKTTLARIIARSLNCMNPDINGEPCGSCRSCSRFDNGNHPDLIERNAADYTGIDSMRGDISHSSFSPQTNYRVFFYDEAHRLSPEARDCLLKSLEEPPPKTLFILATTEVDTFSAIFRDRMLALELQAVPAEQIVPILEKVAIAEGCPAIPVELLRHLATEGNKHGSVRRGLQNLQSTIETIRLARAQLQGASR